MWINTIRSCRTRGRVISSVLQGVAACCMCCSVLQCVAVWCSVLQCVAVCCSVLQCVAVCCSVLQCRDARWDEMICVIATTIHCNTLQHTATRKRHTTGRHQLCLGHCNTLQHTATHCNILQHTASHCKLTRDA